jgi:hypothetical protein
MRDKYYAVRQWVAYERQAVKKTLAQRGGAHAGDNARAPTREQGLLPFEIAMFVPIALARQVRSIANRSDCTLLRADLEKTRAEAAKPAELQDGLAKLKALQAEGGVDAIRAAIRAAAAQNIEDVKTAVAALDQFLTTTGLAPADINGYIRPSVMSSARSSAKSNKGLGSGSLAQLQGGLKEMLGQGQAMVDGIKEAKAQRAEAAARNMQSMNTAVAALDELLAANGLLPDDIGDYLGEELVEDAREYCDVLRSIRGQNQHAEARDVGWSAEDAARLEALAGGLKQLQGAGVVKGIKQAKDQQAEATAQNIQGMETAVAALDELLSANGLVRDDVTQYVTLPIVTGFVQEVSGRCSAGGSRCELKALSRLQEDARSVGSRVSADVSVWCCTSSYAKNHPGAFAKARHADSIVKLAELQGAIRALRGKLQEEGLVERIKEAKAQMEQKKSDLQKRCQKNLGGHARGKAAAAREKKQRRAETKQAVAALDEILSANGLEPGDANVSADLVHSFGFFTLSAEDLAQLQHGLEKLQEAGAVEAAVERKAAREVEELAAKEAAEQAEREAAEAAAREAEEREAAEAAAEEQRRAETKQAVAALDEILSANVGIVEEARRFAAAGLALGAGSLAHQCQHINVGIVEEARRCAAAGLALGAGSLAQMQHDLEKLEAFFEACRLFSKQEQAKAAAAAQEKEERAAQQARTAFLILQQAKAAAAAQEKEKLMQKEQAKAAKAAEKAKKDAEKAAEKAKKDAEKAAEKAKKDAEKAKAKAAKAQARAVALAEAKALAGFAKAARETEARAAKRERGAGDQEGGRGFSSGCGHGYGNGHGYDYGGGGDDCDGPLASKRPRVEESDRWADV